MAVPPPLRYQRSSPRVAASLDGSPSSDFASLADDGPSLTRSYGASSGLKRSVRDGESSGGFGTSLTPSSSLRNLGDLGLGSPPGGGIGGGRERAVSSASTTSSVGGNSTLLRTPLVGLPSPGLEEGGPSSGWGNFGSFSVATSSGEASTPPPPKPQGRKTLDFFAAYTSPPSTSASPNLPSIGDVVASIPLPPPPLRAPVSSVTGQDRVRSARSSYEKEEALHDRQSSANSFDSRTVSRSPEPYRASARAPYTSSPASSRDPSPSPSFSHAIVGHRMENVPSRSRTDDFFSSWSSPGSSPTSGGFPSMPFAPLGTSTYSPPRVITVAPTPTSDSPPPSLPAAASMNRDPSLRTQLFYRAPGTPGKSSSNDGISLDPAPPIRLPTLPPSSSASTESDPGRNLGDVGKLPSMVMETRRCPPAPSAAKTRKQRQEEEARMREEAASEIAIGAVLVDLGSGSGMAKGKGRATEDEQTEGEVGSYDVVKILGEGAFSRVVQGRKRSSGSEGGGEIVAIKMIATAAVDGNERMKSSVGREMGVLKHISHPSIVSLLSSFSTRHHMALVLECADGGELFDLLTSRHDTIDENLARRIFGELCGVVGWMHQAGVVHRDIKLENILLTRRIYSALGLESTSLPPSPEPLIKLSDFGLSRFIDFSSPLLSTRCGSEEYAAPELLMGKAYDGRKTDAWSVGVVGYALLVGWLPFAPDHGLGEHDAVGAADGAPGSTKSRRGYLLKIAKADYSWPRTPSSATRLTTDSARSIVDALLKRDPAKRVTWDELWKMEWFRGTEEGREVCEGVKALQARETSRRPAEGTAEARMLAGEQEQ